MQRPSIFSSIQLLLLCILSTVLYIQAVAAQTDSTKPKIAIIIDDLGHKKNAGREVIDLGIPLAVAVLPQTPHGSHLADYAKQKNVEVMLHLPMQPSFDERLMTPSTLSINMDETRFKQVVSDSLQEIPHVQGVNNHMGSLFTQLPGQMAWLMQSIQAHPEPLFFVDSFTSERSIAFEVAEEHAVPNTKRDVFLDRQLDTQHMEAQMQKLRRVADKQGQVVVIGHPFKETIALLKKHIPELEKQGYEFVKVSSLTQAKRNAASGQEQDDPTKQAFKTLH